MYIPACIHAHRLSVNMYLCRYANVNCNSILGQQRFTLKDNLIPDFGSSYNGWHRDASSLEAWIYNFLPSRATTLTSQNFNALVLDSRHPWIVDFYAPWCGHCQVFKSEFEKVAEVGQGLAVFVQSVISQNISRYVYSSKWN